MNFKNENEYINDLSKKIENEVICTRVIYLLNWYSKKAKYCKRFYFFCVFISIIAPAMITLINGCYPNSLSQSESMFLLMNKECIISLISTIATIIAGVLAITRWQDGWLRYRKMAELIKSELSLYLIERENAENTTAIDNDFIIKIEQIAMDENNAWYNMRFGMKKNDDE